MHHAAQVEKLNTDESLYSALVRALDHHEQRTAAAAQFHPVSEAEQHSGVQHTGGEGLLTPEALRVGRSLRHDMEKAGIHLPHAERSRLTELIGLERRLGMAIGQNSQNSPCSTAVHNTTSRFSSSCLE